MTTPAPGHWLFVVSPSVLALIQAGDDAVAISPRYRARIEQMKAGDTLLLYVTGLKAIAGLAEVESLTRETHTAKSSGACLQLRPLLIVRNPAACAPLLPIAPDLLFLRRWPAKNWTLAFTQPLHLLTTRDHNILLRALRRSAGATTDLALDRARLAAAGRMGDAKDVAAAARVPPANLPIEFAREKERRTMPTMDTEDVAFTGFQPAAFDFFEELAFHQSRDWFLERRDVYESQVRRPFAALIAAVSSELALRNVPMAGHPLQAQFRLHRDIRFSKDKSPFKTHAGASLTRGGTKGVPGMLYVHVDPKGSFIAAGFWQPEPALLSAFRQSIREKPDAALAMRESLSAGGLELDTDDLLTRMPRGYEDMADSPLATMLRMRSFTVHRPVTEDDMATPDVVGKITDFGEAALPLLRFGWQALENIPPGELTGRR